MKTIKTAFGDKMYLDKINTLKLRDGKVYEPFEIELVRHLVKEGDIAVDIGAMIGCYTLVFAKLVGDKGKVFAFEPAPENYKTLQKNIWINEYKNTRILQKAVSDTSGEVSIYLNNGNLGMHTLGKRKDLEKWEEIKVETITLDSYFEKYDKPIDFLKMDIQGAEGLALKGMEKLLIKNEQIKMIVEFSQPQLKGLGDPKECLRLLRQYGFNIFEIDRWQKDISQRKLRKISDIDRFSKRCYERYYHCTWMNLFCVKNIAGLPKRVLDRIDSEDM